MPGYFFERKHRKPDYSTPESVLLKTFQSRFRFQNAQNHFSVFKHASLRVAQFYKVTHFCAKFVNDTITNTTSSKRKIQLLNKRYQSHLLFSILTQTGSCSFASTSDKVAKNSEALKSIKHKFCM